MPASRVCPIRLEARLRRLIDVRRGETSFSAWVRRACVQRIEADQGLGPDHLARLGEHTAQLRGLGVNLNQLAHAANEGRPVVLNPQMLAAIQGLLRESRTLLAEIKQRLPE
jgi:hypothetical protein